MSDNLIQSVKKAMDILDILVVEDYEQAGISLSALSEHLGQRTNTVHNILKTMVACGYVKKIGKGYYRAGDKCRLIGELNGILHTGIRYEQIKKIMLQLSSEIGEPLVFYVMANNKRIPVIHIKPTSVISVDVMSLFKPDLLSTATGRVLAAFAEELPQKLSLDSWEGVNNEEDLLEQLELIRRDGHYKTIACDGEVIAMAVPVRKIKPVASLGCYAPAFRCDGGRTEEIIGLLKKTATQIEETCG